MVGSLLIQINIMDVMLFELYIDRSEFEARDSEILTKDVRRMYFREVIALTVSPFVIIQ